MRLNNLYIYNFIFSANTFIPFSRFLLFDTLCLSLQVKDKSVRFSNNFQGFSQVSDLPVQIQTRALVFLQHSQRRTHFCPDKILQSEIKQNSPVEARVYCVLKLLGVCYHWQRSGNSSEGKTPGWLLFHPQEVAVCKTRYICLVFVNNNSNLHEKHFYLSPPTTPGFTRNKVKQKSKKQRIKKALKLDLSSLKGQCIPGPAQKNYFSETK